MQALDLQPRTPMSLVPPQPVSAEQLNALAQALRAGGLEPIDQPEELKRLSQDRHDFSPVLTPLLRGCRAHLAVRAASVEQVRQVAAACYQTKVPLTVRGAGTGNDGPGVPLAGGLVLDLGGLRRLRQLETDSQALWVEAGALLADIDAELLPHGRALRLAPSTWRSATVGGFIAGGSGGIGSLRWGFLRDPGNLLGLEVVTLEAEPRVLRLDAQASE
ncbi:MAG: FAD-binding oxidoreductase, partial [Synechococcaceae cyanobacterium]